LQQQGGHVKYKRILVPVDGSPTARLGLREAVRLAKDQKAALQLVHVVDEHSVVMTSGEVGAYIADLIPLLRKRGRDILRNAEALVRRERLTCSTVLLETLLGPAADLIVRQAKKWRAQLIVIGTHGRRGLRRLVLGSDAEQIVRTSPVPVLLVRARGRR
jgi:nucleotide-binding universal stress UspA family protein